MPKLSPEALKSKILSPTSWTSAFSSWGSSRPPKCGIPLVITNKVPRFSESPCRWRRRLAASWRLSQKGPTVPLEGSFTQLFLFIALGLGLCPYGFSTSRGCKARRSKSGARVSEKGLANSEGSRCCRRCGCLFVPQLHRSALCVGGSCVLCEGWGRTQAWLRHNRLPRRFILFGGAHFCYDSALPRTDEKHSLMAFVESSEPGRSGGSWGEFGCARAPGGKSLELKADVKVSKNSPTCPVFSHCAHGDPRAASAPACSPSACASPQL